MKRMIPAITAAIICSAAAQAQETVRLGIIGLDTSHSIEFTKLLNDTSSTDAYVQKFEVTAMGPGCESVTRMHSDDGDVVAGREDAGKLLQPYGL